MRNFKVNTIVKLNFNDSKTGTTYEKGEPIVLDRDRYEELLSKGYVEKGEEVKEENKKEKKVEVKEEKIEEE